MSLRGNALYDVIAPLAKILAPKNTHDTVTAMVISSIKVTLRTGTRRLLNAIHKNGGISSLACRAEEGTCNQILETFGIRDRFFYPRYGLMEKGEAILEVLAEIKKTLNFEISTKEVLFLDDAPANTAEARRVGAKALLYGRDVRDLSELKKWC